MTASLRQHTHAHPERSGEHVVHRLAHTIYGLIVLTATVGEIRVHDSQPTAAIALILSGAAVLVIAHSYSQIVAEAALNDETLGWSDIRPVLVDQLALAIPATIATCLILPATGDWWSADTAYVVVLVAALAGLFAAGFAIGTHRHMGRPSALAMALGGTIIGVGVIAIEVAVGH